MQALNTKPGNFYEQDLINNINTKHSRDFVFGYAIFEEGI